MVRVARVLALWRYPVKSMHGETLDALPIEARGVVGDRAFAVRDPAGKLGSGKNSRRFRHIDGLLAFESRLAGAVPVLRFPDGRTLRADDPAIDQVLSEALRTTVTLAPEQTVQHHDVAPLHLVTTSALAWLAAVAPRSAIDVRRFRPNLLIDGASPGLAEHDWLDRELAIGDQVRLRVIAPTERCVMVTTAQDSLPSDPALLRHLAEHNDHCFGVYATVLTPGTIACGDPVTVL